MNFLIAEKNTLNIYVNGKLIEESVSINWLIAFHPNSSINKLHEWITPFSSFLITFRANS